MTVEKDGWLHTGDKAEIRGNHIYITGRVKEIIVLANGEKVPPADMEAAIIMDPLFEQVMVVGEGKPYLSAFIVLNRAKWEAVAKELQVSPTDETIFSQQEVLNDMLKRVGRLLRDFPGYAHIRRICLQLEPWTIDNGLLTPTLKLRRERILARYESEFNALYEGH